MAEAMIGYKKLVVMLSVAAIACVAFLPWNAGAKAPEFDYGEGSSGPSNWGNMKPEWAACSAGQSQSPVNIGGDIAETNRTLKFNYRSGNAELRLDDYQVIVVWTEDVGGVYWGGEEYKLLKFHTHFSSENAVGDKRFPMEMHFVHKGANGKLLVIGILYEYGRSSFFLQKIVSELPEIVGTGRESHDLGNFSLDGLGFGNSYYHFMGSLTTPPCSEGVKWIVMAKKHSMSPGQARRLRRAQGSDNARPLQALNGRTIYKNF